MFLAHSLSMDIMVVSMLWLLSLGLQRTLQSLCLSQVDISLSINLLIYQKNWGIAGSEALFVFRIGRTFYAVLHCGCYLFTSEAQEVPLSSRSSLAFFAAILMMASVWSLRRYLFDLQFSRDEPWRGVFYLMEFFFSPHVQFVKFTL